MPANLLQITRADQRDVQTTKMPRITVSCLQDVSCSKRYDATRISKIAWQEKRIWPITTPRGSVYHEGGTLDERDTAAQRLSIEQDGTTEVTNGHQE